MLPLYSLYQVLLLLTVKWWGQRYRYCPCKSCTGVSGFLWCFKKWLILPCWFPKQKLFLGTSWVSLNVCSREAEIAPVGIYMGSKGEVDKGRRGCMGAGYLMGAQNCPVWREQVSSWIGWNLGYLVWLLAWHHFCQPENPSWGVSEAWSAAGTQIYDLPEILQWDLNDKVGLGLAYWESWREVLPSLGGLSPQCDGYSASL